MAQWLMGEDGELEITKNSIDCVVRKTLWYSANCGDWDGQDMWYARMTMIYPGESSSVSQEESAPEGDPGCAGKMEWRKMQGVETGQVALNREGWRKVLKEAEAHPGL